MMADLAQTLDETLLSGNFTKVHIFMREDGTPFVAMERKGGGWQCDQSAVGTPSERLMGLLTGTTVPQSFYVFGDL